MVSNTLYHLDEHTIEFPNPESALREPNGLLAIGGDLKPERLISAYTNGIFPWYSADDPILWWSPNPRAIFYPKDFQPTQSLIKTLKRGHWSFSINLHFDAVVDACSEPRANENGTWITYPMKAAYKQLHQLNHAHSVEAYYKEELVGGLYGVLIGQVFCGESMYYHRTDASKLAFWALSHHSLQVGIQLIDAQVPNPHLSNLGSISVPRKQFLTALKTFRNDKIDMNSFSPQTIKIPID